MTDQLPTYADEPTDCDRRGYHDWTWTYDTGPAQHCVDCGADRTVHEDRTAPNGWRAGPYVSRDGRIERREDW